jgi:hydrogenase maturation protease
MQHKQIRVIGVGNRFRGDDAAGLVVARRLRSELPGDVEVLEQEGEPAALIAAWEGARAVWLVDAVGSGAEPGSVHRLEAAERELPAGLFRASTHALGIADAVELARALDRLPERVVVYGIGGDDFGAGEGLSPRVEAAVDTVVDRVREEVVACMRRL